MSTALLSGTAAARAAKVSYRKLDYWCRLGLLGEVGYHGSGVYRQLTPAQVNIARFLVVASPAVRTFDATVNTPARMAAVARPGDILVWWVDADRSALYPAGTGYAEKELGESVHDGYQGRIVVWTCP